jgi:hypothetical protein
MSTIVIRDISKNIAVDLEAMSSIRGGAGAPWVFSFPTVGGLPKASNSIINVFQTNTFYTADQMTNQFLNVDVNNASNVNVVPTVVGITQK